MSGTPVEFIVQNPLSISQINTERPAFRTRLDFLDSIRDFASSLERQILPHIEHK